MEGRVQVQAVRDNKGDKGIDHSRDADVRPLSAYFGPASEWINDGGC